MCESILKTQINGNQRPDSATPTKAAELPLQTPMPLPSHRGFGPENSLRNKCHVLRLSFEKSIIFESGLSPDDAYLSIVFSPKHLSGNRPVENEATPVLSTKFFKLKPPIDSKTYSVINGLQAIVKRGASYKLMPPKRKKQQNYKQNVRVLRCMGALRLSFLFMTDDEYLAIQSERSRYH